MSTSGTQNPLQHFKSNIRFLFFKTIKWVFHLTPDSDYIIRTRLPAIFKIYNPKIAFTKILIKRCWVSTSIDRLIRDGWCHGHCRPFIESLQLLCSLCGDSTTVSRDIWHQIQHWDESSKKFGFYNPKKLTIWFRLYNPNQKYFYLFFVFLQGAWE